MEHAVVRLSARFVAPCAYPDSREPAGTPIPRAFFHIHPHVELVCFNGATAAKLYVRYVLPTLNDAQRSIARDTLPSTSAAHASLPLAQKTARWSARLQ